MNAPSRPALPVGPFMPKERPVDPFAPMPAPHRASPCPGCGEPVPVYIEEVAA